MFRIETDGNGNQRGGPNDVIDGCTIVNNSDEGAP